MQKKARKYHIDFFYRTHIETTKIILPKTTSGRRNYVPLGFVDKNIIISNAAFVINSSDTNIFSILSSKMHNLWLGITSAKMNTSFRYAVNFTYNTFPFPPITQAQKDVLEQHTHNILKARANHTQKTLAEMYDPNKMPN